MQEAEKVQGENQENVTYLRVSAVHAPAVNLATFHLATFMGLTLATLNHEP